MQQLIFSRDQSHRRSVAAVGAVAVLSALLAGCGSRGADVYAAARSTDGRIIRLDVRTCNADLTAAVEETAEKVTVSVEARDDYSYGDCSDIYIFELDQPLGSRILVDGFDQEPLEVRVKESLDR
jgi:hypothetical protein